MAHDAAIQDAGISGRMTSS